jgi:PAS domain S-box-containing protein
MAAAVLPTLIAAIATLLYAYSEEQEAFHARLKDTTRALALVVDREIARREAIALTLAGSPTLTRGDLRAFHEYASQIAPTRDKVVVLHALDGTQLVNTRVPFGSPLPKVSNVAAERAAIDPQATLVSNLYFAPFGQQYSFAVQVPVIRDGRPVYYLSLAGFASALQSILQDQRVADGWVASILDAKGVLVARNVGAEKFVGKPASERLRSQMARLAEGSFVSRSIDGHPIRATFSRSPNYGWSVVVGVPLSAATAPLRVIAAFGALAAVLVACALLAAVLIGRRLLQPVERLKAASEAVGSGRVLDAAPTGLLETDQVLAGLRAADQRIGEANRALEGRRAEAEAAAQALRRSNERLHLATETSGLGLFTWRATSDEVEWHNDLPYRIFGITEDEPPITAARFVAEFVHPDDAPVFAASVQKTLERQEPFHFRGRIRLRDGRLRWVEFTGRSQPQGGPEPVIVGTAADVTERVTTEMALRQNEERLRQLANTIPNLAWMADPGGDITWYNDRWYDYTGSTPDEMRGLGWQRVHQPDTLPEVVRRWRESLLTGEPFEMPFVPLRGRDGVFRPFFTRVVPLRDASGAIVQWFGTNTDVSSLKKAEDELREADRRKDEFLAMLAHELRNPLAPIRTAAELLRRLRSDEPQLARASEIIARQVTHMSGLLSDLLDVSRITRGLITIEPERVNIAAVVAGAMEQVRPLLEARRHHVHAGPFDADLEVMGSSLRLTQVVANLLDNAAKYSPPQSTIRVDVRRSGDQVHIEVADNGQGISAELLPRVFEPFTQAERGSHRSGGGLGLGLAVVRGLVALQGGRVSAHSEGPGRGSRFVVDLPVAPPPPQAGAAAAVASVDVPARLLDVVVVDDNQDAADTLAALLRGVGHRVQCVYTAREGLDLMCAGSFDAAVLDIGLPDMSGYALAATIRTRGLRVGTLIALSGYGQPADRASSASAGFDHHLVKPVEPQSLIEILARSARQSARSS